MDLQVLKGFLRIDGSEDDHLLASLVSAAKSAMRKAGVEEPKVEPEAPEEEKKKQAETLEQYNLAIMLYVKREYDPLTGLELERIKNAIEGIILQLRDYSQRGGEDDA
ncbi:head-tail connector protein [Halalkalibacterium halodurans]|uniref:head-tail connector protein n=1 Tax=Halalkalibacterium halodurans TaxID=86665 RepID=UPI002AAA3810|nr:head-tail connector protein [Halalkalibacterium halodurans]MDY7222083.1 head-tail connector protein [Halalkalibacterium halodurans]MDY7243898.1 head-tail connector protein [Halalkalibacterium halodurans]